MLEGAQYIHVRLMQRVHLMRYHIVCYSRRHLRYCLIIVGTLCWYDKLTVQIKWCKQLSVKISVYIATRQGGISSTLLFNILYQELVDALSKCPGGISINNDSFNVFCYADDLILTTCSLSVTGLQELIDIASSYIIAHGLKFNASKTICTSLGAKHFKTTPGWHLNGPVLREEAAVTYLGLCYLATLSFILTLLSLLIVISHIFSLMIV